MLRPISLSPLIQDLLSLRPDMPHRVRLRLPQLADGPFDTTTLTERPAPFSVKLPTPFIRNFGPQDPLGLAAHPRLRAALADIPGATPVANLEVRLAHFLHMPSAIVFPSESAAIRAALVTVLQAGDDVILDAAADSAMFETVYALQATPHRSPPGSLAGVERRLRRLSATPRAGRLWVAVPAVSAHASTMADLAELAALCQHFNAGLIVDVTRDLGSMAQDGGGVMELQGCVGRADVVIGSFARAFCAPGAFVAIRNPDLNLRLRRAQSHTAALWQVHAATILAALDLIDSAEGQRRRRRLHALSLRLRNQLLADGLTVMGHPSPIVPVKLPVHAAVGCTALLYSAGTSVGLLCAPTVASNAPRWCLHLTAHHSPADIDNLADLIRDVARSFAHPRW